MHRVACVLVVVLGSIEAAAYGVGPAVALEELAKKADIICKATATASKKLASDPTLGPVHGYPVYETDLRTVGCLKGTAGKTFKFRHYAYDPPPNSGMSFSPQHYKFVPGKTYVVFAVGKGGVYRQLDKFHTAKEDQGVYRTGDDKPLQGTTATDALGAEFDKMLASTLADDVVYAIEQLDEMSNPGGLHVKLKDFDRQASLAKIRPLVKSNDAAIAAAAIGVFGGDSPFYIEDDAPYWLAGTGKGSINGLSARKPPAITTAEAAVSELVAVANGSGPANLRALAIRALGKTKAITPQAVTAWGKSPDVEVRRAAIAVSSQIADRSLITKALADPDPTVRRAGVLAAGFSQDAKFLPQLGKLLTDSEGKVRSGAAMAILSFAHDVSASLMKAQLSSDFMPLFVNILAKKDPRPYLAKLAEVVEKHLQPKDWWGGRIPAADSWEILFEYVRAQPAADLAKPPIVGLLDSLEKMQWVSSSEPRNLYALYVRRGLTVRAKNFRDTLKKTASYVEQYLNEADQHPERFVP